MLPKPNSPPGQHASRLMGSAAKRSVCCCESVFKLVRLQLLQLLALELSGTRLKPPPQTLTTPAGVTVALSQHWTSWRTATASPPLAAQTACRHCSRHTCDTGTTEQHTDTHTHTHTVSRFCGHEQHHTPSLQAAQIAASFLACATVRSSAPLCTGSAVEQRLL